MNVVMCYICHVKHGQTSIELMFDYVISTYLLCVDCIEDGEVLKHVYIPPVKRYKVLQREEEEKVRDDEED